jgi:bla regulator protein blaR1
MISRYLPLVWSAIAPAMANHLWQSTLFAVVAAILTLALRKNQARVRYYIWLAASLKFLVPCSLLIGLGGHLARLPFWVNAQTGMYSTVRNLAQPFTFVVTPGAVTGVFLFPLLAGTIWFCGFVVVLGLWSLRWRQVASVMREAIAVTQGREVDTLRHMERTEGALRPTTFLLSRDSLEPGIFGIFRPVLLWPEAISEQLPDKHLRAILTHEISHLRRRDNLAAAIHMAVEAIFWFHPLVWWLGTRLLEERERACDEAVLQKGHSPQIYAESILKTCSFCIGSPLTCISGVTGGDLKLRIIRIMTPGSVEKLSRRRRLLLAGVGIAAVVAPVIFGLLNAPPLSAQSPHEPDGQQQARDTVIHNRFTSFATSEQTYRVGGEVSAPKLIFAPDPVYSEEARRAKYQGVCVVALIVDARGKPQRIQVVRHLGMGLDKKAIEAVKQYRFTPGMLHGKPVAVQVNIEINFRLY